MCFRTDEQQDHFLLRDREQKATTTRQHRSQDQDTGNVALMILHDDRRRLAERQQLGQLPRVPHAIIAVAVVHQRVHPVRLFGEAPDRIDPPFSSSLIKVRSVQCRRHRRCYRLARLERRRRVNMRKLHAAPVRRSVGPAGPLAPTTAAPPFFRDSAASPISDMTTGGRHRATTFGAACSNVPSFRISNFTSPISRLRRTDQTW